MPDVNDLKLRRPKIEDAEQMSEIANNFNIWINVRDTFPHPYTKDDAVFFINLCLKENPVVTFAIEYLEEIVGFTGFILLDDIYKNTAELGFWIGESYWNKGIASMTVQKMIAYGFQELNLRRIHASVFDYNKASARVLEKNNFVQEGHFKNAITKNDKICDEIRYALLNND